MLRKLLLGAAAAAGLMFFGTEADAGWRRDARRGYYNPYYGGYYSYRVPRRSWRNQYRYYSQPYDYYSQPYYYGGYYQPYYYGYGGAIATPWGGVYWR